MIRNLAAIILTYLGKRTDHRVMQWAETTHEDNDQCHDY